jgi:hypothetical protein
MEGEIEHRWRCLNFALNRNFSRRLPLHAFFRINLVQNSIGKETIDLSFFPFIF